MLHRYITRLAVSLPLIVTALPLSASAGRTVIDAVAGKTLILELEGNPTTGYTWQAHIPRRERPLIRVDGCGWQAKAATPKRMVGAPGRYRCRITPLKPGDATITFRYLRTWEKIKTRPKTRSYLFKIK